VNCEKINKKQLSESASTWTLKHAGNIGINWPQTLDFPEHHPATHFGKVPSIEHKTTTTEMKLFLEPILAKKGPSGDHMYFRNLKQQDPQPSQMFNNIITDLKAICSDPKNEAHVKNMLIHLCIAVGLDDSGNGLVARGKFNFCGICRGCSNVSKT